MEINVSDAIEKGVRWVFEHGPLAEIKIRNKCGRKVHLYSYAYNSVQGVGQWTEHQVLEKDGRVALHAGTGESLQAQGKKLFYVHMYEDDPAATWPTCFTR
eukprot:2233663-Rhodomonas_salina.1